MKRTTVLLVAMALGSVPATTAFAAGEVILTHQKALAGNVTPGDTAGYPIVVSVSGYYQLNSNLNPPAGKNGINITAHDVTIDLHGFRINGANVANFGIVSSRDRLTIRDGTVMDFKFDGINGSGNYWIVENLRSLENGRDGIFVGAFAIIKSSMAVKNAGRGIVTDISAVIQGNTVSENGLFGIDTARSTVVQNAINVNGSYGLVGGATTGYSGNTLRGNDYSGGKIEAFNVTPHQPNACTGACP
jgi:hypothetical protein